ncbi:MAG TPA: phosphomannomutase/phosphoglucomutase [Oceanospirillales bacterium]|nr:phosphomannomutase/phosphoglucomutase [Oceanospirillales bacterium]
MSTLSSTIGFLSSLLLLAGVILNVKKKLKEFKEMQEKEKIYVHVPKPIGIEDSEEESQASSESGQLSSIKKKLNISGEFVLDKTMFRAYDIRGIVDESLTTEAVTLIGQAIGTENLKRGKESIVVARDGRLSGPSLLQALVEGLTSSGCEVINIGAVPTGVLYFATHHLGTGSGVMLTGSHNPPDYNGLKIMLDGETLAGDSIMALYDAIMSGDLQQGEGMEQEMDIVDDYVDHIASDIQLENELKVVVDCGNGIGGEVGPLVLEEIGCEVIPLHCEVDGNFPNHHPDPSVPKNLEDLIMSVKASSADIGIAFDGDADRLGVVSKTGEMIYPDRLLMLFAQDVLTRQPGASIIFDVKCTGHLPKEIVKSGGLPIIWKTGHSFMKAKIKETNAALAGEMSGHFFFNERWFGFDDGIYAAARLLEIIDQEDRPAQEIFDELPNSVSTPELKCITKEGENYAFMEKFQKAASFPDANITTIDGIRADFADGWGLVRCSNTTPCLVLRFDANNEEALERIKAEFKQQILAVDDSLNLPF